MRAPPNRKRALKLSAGDRAVARDCLKSGFGLGQATLHVEAHRLKKLEKEVEEGLREMNENLEELASISKEWVRVTMQRDDGDVHRRQTKKSGTTDPSAGWAVDRLPRTGGTAWRRSGGAPVSVRNSQNLRRYTRTRAALKAVVDAVNIYATRFFR